MASALTSMSSITSPDDLAAKLKLRILPTRVRALSNQTVDQLGITRKDLDYYAKYVVTAHPERHVNKYVELYWARRYELQQSDHGRELGKIHHKIDQIYARLIGHRSAFRDVPLGKIRIKSDKSVAAVYWNAVAGLVIFAEERSAEATEHGDRAANVVNRWGQSARAMRAAGSLTPQQESLVVFTEQILGKWEAFKKSWDNPKHHDSRIWQFSRPINGYVQHDTAEYLYKDAQKEYAPLFGNWEGDAELADLIRGLPPWFKIAYYTVLRAKLIAQYGRNTNLRLLDPNVGTPKTW